jgi:hypothetical protein
LGFVEETAGLVSRRLVLAGRLGRFLGEGRRRQGEPEHDEKDDNGAASHSPKPPRLVCSSATAG